MTKKNKKKDYKIIYLSAIVILILILAISFFSHKKQPSDSTNQPEMTEEEAIDFEKENIIAKLQDMEERERMEFYFSMFWRNIENQEYEEAYDFLYSEFKQTYFPTLESFTQYVQTKFPKMAAIEYENIERNGDVYVLWVHIADALNGKQTDEKQQINVVIQENDYNDFVMSFSVI